ncbi:hypothetical protein CAC42_2834 [Sphaceloma murrayae]|uniref:DRBM domain-containing protein n=1 Tax=Sphaceloma murrayae TaxID=2082308 RepID=A0A2K1R152_9PEZI|nr:hypothetical protein CAC42_2834 [Sphaceloma murrayae]
MFYIMYLTSLCTRRNWPDPQFTIFQTRRGYGCVVRVNNREYTTGETMYESGELAKNAAATQAYMICRNFSVNDGMLPGQRPGMAVADAACQGLPAAIGTGRHRRTTTDSGGSGDHTGEIECASSSGSSGGDSPRRLSDGGRAIMAAAGARRGSDRRGSGVCQCRRGYIAGYGRCAYCLREAGYA